jgi:asparagine N-glycosylation enzyme membrane subunit Stt3
MIALFVAAGLTPVLFSLGLVLWLSVVRRDPLAASVAGSVAIGLAAGALLGSVVGLALILLVIAGLRAAGR